MKTLIAVLLAMPFLQGCNQQPQNGHFQIIAGTYEEVDVGVSGNGSSTQHHGIFKLDTRTGTAWEYFDATVATTNGALGASGWKEIKDLK